MLPIPASAEPTGADLTSSRFRGLWGAGVDRADQLLYAGRKEAERLLRCQHARVDEANQ